MNLIKTSIFSLIATIIKMMAALVINKAISVYVGPTGLALVGQFQNFIQLARTAAQGAINNGVTKYVSEYGKDSDKVPILFSTASKISIVTSVSVGVVIALLAPAESLLFLKSENYDYVFIVFGFTIILFVINNLLLSILNGLKEIKTFIIINIMQSLYNLVFTTLLIVFLGLDGALIALVTNQSVTFIVVLWILRTHKIIKLESFKRKFSSQEAKKLLGFSVMGLTSATIVPISHLVLRNYIGDNLGWEDAGYWQAVWYVSTMYLSVVTTTLTVYYLPKLSELTDRGELRKEILHGYKIIMPIVIAMSFFVFLIKDIIISLLFTKEFAPISALFKWQLIGDVIKMAAWLLSYLMLAKAKIKSFIFSEVLFSLLFVILSILFIDTYGLIGVTYAFALNYLLYLSAVSYIVKDELF